MALFMSLLQQPCMLPAEDLAVALCVRALCRRGGVPRSAWGIVGLPVGGRARQKALFKWGIIHACIVLRRVVLRRIFKLRGGRGAKLPVADRIRGRRASIAAGLDATRLTDVQLAAASEVVTQAVALREEEEAAILERENKEAREAQGTTSGGGVGGPGSARRRRSQARARRQSLGAQSAISGLDSGEEDDDDDEGDDDDGPDDDDARSKSSKGSKPSQGGSRGRKRRNSALRRPDSFFTAADMKAAATALQGSREEKEKEKQKGSKTVSRARAKLEKRNRAANALQEVEAHGKVQDLVRSAVREAGRKNSIADLGAVEKVRFARRRLSQVSMGGYAGEDGVSDGGIAGGSQPRRGSKAAAGSSSVASSPKQQSSSRGDAEYDGGVHDEASGSRPRDPVSSNGSAHIEAGSYGQYVSMGSGSLMESVGSDELHDLGAEDLGVAGPSEGSDLLRSRGPRRSGAESGSDQDSAASAPGSRGDDAPHSPGSRSRPTRVTAGGARNNSGNKGGMGGQTRGGAHEGALDLTEADTPSEAEGMSRSSARVRLPSDHSAAADDQLHGHSTGEERGSASRSAGDYGGLRARHTPESPDEDAAVAALERVGSMSPRPPGAPSRGTGNEGEGDGGASSGEDSESELARPGGGSASRRGRDRSNRRGIPIRPSGSRPRAPSRESEGIAGSSHGQGTTTGSYDDADGSPLRSQTVPLGAAHSRSRSADPPNSARLASGSGTASPHRAGRPPRSGGGGGGGGAGGGLAIPDYERKARLDAIRRGETGEEGMRLREQRMQMRRPSMQGARPDQLSRYSDLSGAIQAITGGDPVQGSSGIARARKDAEGTVASLWSAARLGRLVRVSGLSVDQKVLVRKATGSTVVFPEMEDGSLNWVWVRRAREIVRLTLLQHEQDEVLDKINKEAVTGWESAWDNLRLPGHVKKTLRLALRVDREQLVAWILQARIKGRAQFRSALAHDFRTFDRDSSGGLGYKELSEAVVTLFGAGRFSGAQLRAMFDAGVEAQGEGGKGGEEGGEEDGVPDPWDEDEEARGTPFARASGLELPEPPAGRRDPAPVGEWGVRTFVFFMEVAASRLLLW